MYRNAYQNVKKATQMFLYSKFVLMQGPRSLLIIVLALTKFLQKINQLLAVAALLPAKNVRGTRTGAFPFKKFLKLRTLPTLDYDPT